MPDYYKPLMHLIYTIRARDYCLLPHAINCFYDHLIRHNYSTDADKIIALLDKLEKDSFEITLTDIKDLNHFACACIHYAPESFITTGRIFKLISGLLAYNNNHPDTVKEPGELTGDLLLFYTIAQHDTVILNGLSLKEKIEILIQYEYLKLSSQGIDKGIALLDAIHEDILDKESKQIIDILITQQKQETNELKDFFDYCFACLPRATHCWLMTMRDSLELLLSILSNIKQCNEQLQNSEQLINNPLLTETLMHHCIQVQSQRVAIKSLLNELEHYFTNPINSILVLQKINLNRNYSALHKKTADLILEIESIDKKIMNHHFQLWTRQNNRFIELKTTHKRLELFIDLPNAYTEKYNVCANLYR